jgi:DNA polymerase III subunit epsilon
MSITDYFKEHAIRDYKVIKYENTFVRLLYKIIFYLQNYLTISSYVKTFMYRRGNKKLFHRIIVPSWVFIWFFGVIILYFLSANNWITIILFLYRLWEIFIINLWMFVFQRSSQSISVSIKEEENTIRFIFLLIIQYFTIVFCFAGINRFIYFTNPISFYGIYNKTINWLYHSVVTLTTLGYGDIVPNQEAFFPQISVIFESIFGMFFVLLFLGVIIKQLNFQYENNSNIYDNKYYCFIDLETTGSDFSKDYPIQIGAILVDLKNLNIQKDLSLKINIPEGVNISKKAENIHGLNFDDIKGEMDSKQVLGKFFKHFGTDYAFAGWNVCFDVSFFRKICIENGFNKEYKKINFHHLDIQSIARYHKLKGKINCEISLSNIVQLFNLKRSKYHDALEDAKLSYEVFKKLLQL